MVIFPSVGCRTPITAMGILFTIIMPRSLSILRPPSGFWACLMLGPSRRRSCWVFWWPVPACSLQAAVGLRAVGPGCWLRPSTPSALFTWSTSMCGVIRWPNFGQWLSIRWCLSLPGIWRGIPDGRKIWPFSPFPTPPSS